jgi:hypothetical protein
MPVAPGFCFVAGLAKTGATAKLWSSARFASPPEKDTPLPSGAPTDSRLTSTADGGDGTYRFTVTPGLWYVSLEYNGSIFYDTHDIKNPLAAPTVKDYGAVGDGLTDDTTAVQAALSDTAEGMIVFPQGSYLCGNLTLNNRSNFIVEGQGAVILWDGTAGAGDQIGLQLTGTNQNVTVRNMEFRGDNVAANGHAGLWWKNGASVQQLTIRDCWIWQTARGVSGIRSSSGTWSGILIEGCYCQAQTGTGAGQGEGIYLESNATAPLGVRILGNQIDSCDQYSIHLARGIGFTVEGNDLTKHRIGTASGVAHAAILVERCREVVIRGNKIQSHSDGAIHLVPVSGTTTRNITIEGNLIQDAGTAVPDLVIGTATPAADGAPEEILVTANQIYRGAYRNAALVDLKAGLRVSLRGNLFVHLGVTGTPEMLSIEGAGDSGGTRAYNDDIEVGGNTFYATTSGGGAVAAISLSSALCSSIARLGFRGNRFNTTSSFAVGASVTDPNVQLADQPNDGLTFDAANQSNILGMGRLLLAGTRSAQTSFASAAGRHGFAQGSPTSVGHFGGAIAWPLPSTAKTADYVFLEGDGTVKFDATAANRAATLPDPATCAGRICIVKLSAVAGGHTLTVAGAAGNTDGAASVSLSSANECWGFQSDGVGWWSIFTK